MKECANAYAKYIDNTMDKLELDNNLKKHNLSLEEVDNYFWNTFIWE